jgi:serine/threonine-protein kinase RsbW
VEKSSIPTSSPQQVLLKVTSDPANLAHVRKAIERFATGHGFDERSVAEIGLCVNEAMANIIRHAYRGRYDRPIHVATAMNEHGRTLIITLRDWGSGIDPGGLPCCERDPLQPGGVGLICLRQWMDEITYAPQADGGVLTTMKRRRKG